MLWISNKMNSVSKVELPKQYRKLPRNWHYKSMTGSWYKKYFIIDEYGCLHFIFEIQTVNSYTTYQCEVYNKNDYELSLKFFWICSWMLYIVQACQQCFFKESYTKRMRCWFSNEKYMFIIKKFSHIKNWTTKDQLIMQKPNKNLRRY